MSVTFQDPGVSEKCLLMAVRDALRAAGYTPQQCEIEFDEMAPGTIGDVYLSVMAGGWRPGPRHNTQSGVADLVFGVDVAVVKRTRAVPRDRLRDAFLLNMGALDADIGKAFAAIDWNYTLMAAANSLIEAENGSTEGFVEPLRFTSIERRPRLANPDLFAGGGQGAAGMIRTISFHGARRLTHK